MKCGKLALLKNIKNIIILEHGIYPSVKMCPYPKLRIATMHSNAALEFSINDEMNLILISEEYLCWTKYPVGYVIGEPTVDNVMKIFATFIEKGKPKDCNTLIMPELLENEYKRSNTKSAKIHNIDS